MPSRFLRPWKHQSLLSAHSMETFSRPVQRQWEPMSLREHRESTPGETKKFAIKRANAVTFTKTLTISRLVLWRFGKDLYTPSSKTTEAKSKREIQRAKQKHQTTIKTLSHNLTFINKLWPTHMSFFSGQT